MKSDGGVAVNHLTGWTGTNWVLAFGILLVVPAVLGASVKQLRAYVGDGALSTPWTVAAGAGGFGALVVQAVCLWTVARHLPELRWTIVVVGIAIAACAVAIYWYADPSRTDDYRYLSPLAKWVPRVSMTIVGLIGVGTVLGDAANRAAAWFPMAVGMFVGGVVLLIVAGVVYAFVP